MKQICNVPDFVPLENGRFGVDNLEYHLMTREHDYINTARRYMGNNALSIPNLSSQGNLVPNQAPPAMGPSLGGPQVIHIVSRKMSSDEDNSDEHEYYNDNYYDSSRELQPLNNRRNETTV